MGGWSTAILDTPTFQYRLHLNRDLSKSKGVRHTDIQGKALQTIGTVDNAKALMQDFAGML